MSGVEFFHQNDIIIVEPGYCPWRNINSKYKKAYAFYNEILTPTRLIWDISVVILEKLISIHKKKVFNRSERLRP